MIDFVQWEAGEDGGTASAANAGHFWNTDELLPEESGPLKRTQADGFGAAAWSAGNP